MAHDGGAGAGTDEAGQRHHHGDERERRPEPGDREPHRSGEDEAERDREREHRDEDAEGAEQDQPGAAVRRGHDERLQRVLVRAVGGGDAEHGDERGDEQERREGVASRP